MVINKDDGTGEARAFAERAGIPVLAAIPAHDDIRRKSASYEIIGRPGTQWAPLFEKLAQNVADAPPVRPTPLTQDELLGLFSGDAVGRDVVLEPATQFDMCGKQEIVEGVARSRLRRRLMTSTTSPHLRSASLPTSTFSCVADVRRTVEQLGWISLDVRDFPSPALSDTLSPQAGRGLG